VEFLVRCSHSSLSSAYSSPCGCAISGRDPRLRARGAAASKRKLIGFDPETLQALELLSRDSGKSVQELADEAFNDLLAKHHRPRTLKDALKQSSQR
jgi:hypothetical protein